MSIPALGAAGASSIQAFQPTQFTSPSASTTNQTTGGSNAFLKGLDSANQLQTNADNLANQVATGQLDNIADFTTAAAKASLAVSLTAALRNRAVEAYQDIMRMQV